MFSSPRNAVFLGVAALGLVCSPSHAEQTIKATLLMNTIQLNASDVKAGTVTFEVSNAPDTGLKHELVVLKTDLAADKLPVKNGRVSESQFKKMGEVEDIDPGKNKRLTLKLAPGHYVLICNQPGHYSMGLHTSLLVTP
ncbi:cupredoxin domain-containing protein [Paraburkholderia fungorum]|uniref:cupredoxin domain-containing protein n=1 Tax=Paraburkholderia fungorum TaxID=134537 RepID=UPI0038BC2EE5